MNTLKKLFPIIMILVILFGVNTTIPAFAAANGTVSGCEQWHTVQRGEYLTAIAKTYNTSWRALAEINSLKNPNLIFPGQKLCVSLGKNVPLPTVVPPSNTSVRVYASSVREDQTVTLKGRNLTAETRYTVYLRNDKARFAIDIQVGTVTTDKDGAFKATYSIPKKLYDVARLKVTIRNSKGDTANNWFYNATSDSNTGGIGSPVLSFKIDSTKEDKWVKIKTSNLPANVIFTVFMGKAGSQGDKGAIQVGTLKDTKGGTVTATFDIPEALQGRSKLDIRLESDPFEIVSYLTFENK